MFKSSEHQSLNFGAMQKEHERGEKEQTLNEAYRLAKRSLDEDEIKLDDFSDLYDLRSIEKDKEFVANKEKEFSQQSEERKKSNRLATIFEGLVHLNGDRNLWFGPDANMIRVSRYDDLVNYADGLVEFDLHDQYYSRLALAMDVTFESRPLDKLQGIKKSIDNGELTKIKYFLSENSNMRAELTKIPRVIIEADPKMIEEMAALWVQKNMKALGEHPFQIIMLEQLIIQLAEFAEYANKIGEGELAKIFIRSLRIVREILRGKEDLYKNLRGNEKFIAYRQKIIQRLKQDLQEVFGI